MNECSQGRREWKAAGTSLDLAGATTSLFGKKSHHFLNMEKVRIDNWKKGAVTVSAIKIVRNSTSLGLASSKKSIEDALEGRIVVLTPRTGIKGEELVAKLLECGFSASVVDE